MKPVLTGDNGDQAANISNILACEDHPGPFTAGPPEPLGLIPRWPWWGCIYVRSVPLGSAALGPADVLGSRPRKWDQVAPECARLRADFGRSGLGPESAFRALSALRRLFLAAGWPPMGRSGSVGFRVVQVALCHWAYVGGSWGGGAGVLGGRLGGFRVAFSPFRGSFCSFDLTFRPDSDAVML